MGREDQYQVGGPEICRLSWEGDSCAAQSVFSVTGNYSRVLFHFTIVPTSLAATMIVSQGISGIQEPPANKKWKCTEKKSKT